MDAAKGSEIRKTTTKTGAALRFVLVAVPGLLVFLGFLLALVVEIWGAESTQIHPVAAVPACLLGILMMLYGAGHWGQWRYIWVFVAIPISIFIYDSAGLEFLDTTLDIGLVAGVSAGVTAGVVRKSYAKVG